MTEQKRCCVKQWEWGYETQCHRDATVERDGKHYCRWHDPLAVEKKKQKRLERYAQRTAEQDAERAAKKLHDAYVAECLAACEGVEGMQQGELKRLRRERSMFRAFVENCNNFAGYCEACGKPIDTDEDYSTDEEGVKLCCICAHMNEDEITCSGG